MSLQESFLLSAYISTLVSLLWKWNKVLLFLVNLELMSIFILISFLMSSGSNVFLLLLVFFVSEALILLSAFFSSLRSSGSGHSLIMFW